MPDVAHTNGNGHAPALFDHVPAGDFERLQRDLDRERSRFRALMVDFENLQTELVAKRREIAGLRGLQTKRENDEQLTAAAEEVFAFWRKTLRPYSRVFGEARRRKVLDRLKEGHSVAELKQAIDGARLEAFVSEDGKRYDDLVTIMRDEAQVERFAIASRRRDRLLAGLPA